MSLRKRFLDIIGNPDAVEPVHNPDAPPPPAARRSSRASSAQLPNHVTAELKEGTSITHETLDVLTRSTAIKRMSALKAGPDQALGLSSESPKRIRLEKLSKALMSVQTWFDAVPYGLSVAQSDRGLGGVALAFDFYCSLFTASKQLAADSSKLKTEDVLRAHATISMGNLSSSSKVRSCFACTALLAFMSQLTET
jgi:hypothetical protein